MKKIVIIGGGFAGAYCAKKLENDFQVTLVDDKDYFEFTPGVLRTLVEPEHRFRIQAMHLNYLKKTRFLNESVVSISDKEVKTKRRKLGFDYLIIASGSKYNSPLKSSNVVQAVRADILHKYQEEARDAESIGIIGGGVVGVELAAELIKHYPAKNVSIVTGGEDIMERSNEAGRKYARKFLEKQGVEIHCNEKIESVRNKICLTSSGKKLKFDLVFLCTGITPNSDFMKGKFANLDEKKFIKVNEFLQLPNYPNIFVGGDVTSIAEEKLAQTAEKHAGIIVENINRLEKGKELLQYLPKKRTMVISLGPKDGIIECKKMIITGFFAAVAKRLVEMKAMWKYR